MRFATTATKLIFAALLCVPERAIAKDCTFYPACDKRLNLPELESTVKAQRPEAELEYYECEKWEAFPYSLGKIPAYLRPEDIPVDNSQPYSKPAALIVRNVPEEIECSQVRQFLVNHNPAETDDEERERKRVDNRDEQLNKLPTIKDILQRLQALENP